jgi:putative SOS response-associated peptidase YedK
MRACHLQADLGRNRRALPADAFPTGVNTRARYNVCPTTTVDAILDQDGKRRLERMRWGLIPSWWSKPLKEMRLATFNARAETVATKPMFRSAFKRNRCLIPLSGYYEWQDTPDGKQPWYFTARLAGTDDSGALGRMAGQGERRNAQVLHHANNRAQVRETP